MVERPAVIPGSADVDAGDNRQWGADGRSQYVCQEWLQKIKNHIRGRLRGHCEPWELPSLIL